MTQIKLRRDTSVNFTSKNPVLGLGEPAYETDTKKLKIGDGTTAYNSLAYFTMVDEFATYREKYGAPSDSIPVVNTGNSITIKAGVSIETPNGTLTNPTDITYTYDFRTDRVLFATENDYYHAYAVYYGGKEPSPVGEQIFWFNNNVWTAIAGDGAKTVFNTQKITPIAKIYQVDGVVKNIDYSSYSQISTGDAPSNMVTTDTAQTITGQKEFNHTILSLNQDLIRGQQSTSYRNGAGLSMGSNSTGTDGGVFAPQWTIYNTQGGVDRTETIMTTYNQSKLNASNFNTANKLVRLDSSGKLPAIDGSQLTNLPGGSSEPPANMVTTDTTQTITGLKTFGGTDLSKILLEGSESLINFRQNADSLPTTLIGGFFDSNGKKSITIGSKDHETLSLNAKSVQDGSGNKFLTSGDKKTIMGYIMPDYSTRTEVPWNTNNTAPTDGYVEVMGQGDGATNSFKLIYIINGAKTVVSSAYSSAPDTKALLPVICPKGTIYKGIEGAHGHSLHFISMKGAV